MKTTQQKAIWTRVPSVMRAGKFFYVAGIGTADKWTITQSPLSNRWLVRHNERELPVDWATASEAERYAEMCGQFGRSSHSA